MGMTQVFLSRSLFFIIVLIGISRVSYRSGSMLTTDEATYEIMLVEINFMCLAGFEYFSIIRYVSNLLVVRE